jgi:hypothetical protein
MSGLRRMFEGRTGDGDFFAGRATPREANFLRVARLQDFFMQLMANGFGRTKPIRPM